MYVEKNYTCLLGKFYRGVHKSVCGSAKVILRQDEDSKDRRLRVKMRLQVIESRKWNQKTVNRVTLTLSQSRLFKSWNKTLQN